MEILRRLKRDATTRNKLLLTIGILFAILIGYRIPLPGIDIHYLRVLFGGFANSGLGGFLNSLTGSSMQQMSIFGLGIAPYITASIILQLLTVIIPRLQAISKDGSVGKQKMDRLTLIIGAIIALIEALSLAIGLGKKGLFVSYTWYMVVYATIVWTVGACILIWIGQTITKKLIGNGISLILMFNMLISMPKDIVGIFNALTYKSEWWIALIVGLVMAIVIFLVFAYVVLMHNAERRILITNSNKAGMKMHGADNNHLPLKLTMGGVMPIIFASSIMSLPIMIAQICGVDPNSTLAKVLNCFNQGMWFRPSAPIYTLGVIAFIPLVFLFSYFYSIVSFNTQDIADNLRKSGSVINGIRPGQPTADYLKKQMNSMLVIGTAMLTVVVLLPTIISGVFGLTGLSFGGTTIIIVVSGILEMKNTILAQTSSVTYKSLIKKRGASK